MMTRLTQDIIGLAAFGYDFNAVPTFPAKNPQSSAYDSILEQMKIRERNIFLQTLPNSVYLSLTKSGREFASGIRQINDIAKEIIQNRLNGHQPKTPDLLSYMMSTDEAGEPALDKDELLEDVTLFLFAGHETTATTLTWALYLLAKNPAALRQVREEIATLSDPSNLTYDELSKLKYTTNVVKETLRLYSPVVAFARESVCDQKVGDYLIPADVPILFNSFYIHRNPAFWPNPYTFDPDRFTPENSKGRHPFAWSPFAVGLRNCIGQPFSLLEARAVLAVLIDKFDWEIEREPTMNFNVLLRPSDPLMRVSLRK